MAGGSSGGVGGQGGTAGSIARRLPLPCNAPFPTGFCLVSEPGDSIANGSSYTAAGTGSVKVSFSSGSAVEGRLHDAATNGDWFFNFASPADTILAPGLYTNVQRYAFQVGATAGIAVYPPGSPCSKLTAQFSIEEVARDPVAGLTRFSATFEQHCEGAPPALRGVVNFQATGQLDPTPMPERRISLSGRIFRIAYDPMSNVAYGLDRMNRKLAKIDLASGRVTYASVVQIPNAACVDAARGRLYVVNKGSALISVYASDTLAHVQDVSWPGKDPDPTRTFFKIYCTPNTVYVVDGATAPGLFAIRQLDAPMPTVTDLSTTVSGVGDLAVNAAGSELYFWDQEGWGAGKLISYVNRLRLSDFSGLDQSATDLTDFNREPVEAPLLLDEVDGYVLVKNKIFDRFNLTKVIYTLPGVPKYYSAAPENAFALDATHGRLATKDYVYNLHGFAILGPTDIADSDQEFFDSDGTLWMLSSARGALYGQSLSSD
jgi:DNA-binding beta-propeller fold protein YncE